MQARCACVLIAFVVFQPLPYEAAQSCPSFALDNTIARITPQDRVFSFNGGFVAFVHEVRLDTDGSPVAYGPQNQGTTHLCNGLDPILDGKRVTDKSNSSPCFAAVRAAMQAGWRRAESPSFCIYGFFAPGTRHPVVKCDAWGGAFGTGEIPRQGEGDPAPGFFVSMTSATNPGVASNASQAKYLDSDRTPYAVIPAALVQKKLLPRVGVAWAWNPKSDRTAAAVFGDTQSKFGEISVAFAQRLERGRIDPISAAALALGASELPWPYGKRRTGEVRLTGSPTGPVFFVYFSQPPVPQMPNYDPATIDAAADTPLRAFAGPDGLKACLKPLLQP